MLSELNNANNMQHLLVLLIMQYYVLLAYEVN